MRKFVSLLAALTVMIGLLTACTSSPTPVAPTPEAYNTSVQLSWTHDSAWTGVYVADKKGYFADENVALDLLTGGYDADGNFIDPIVEVAEGRADFGIADASLLLQARQDYPVVGVASLFGRHPLALTSLAEKNIRTPEDLVGKTVQISYNSRLLFDALLATKGIDPASVNVVERTDFTIEPLLSGEADVIDAWVINEIPILTRQGHEFNMIVPADYGIVMYPDILFTTEDMIENHPDVVQAVVNATMRGLQGTLDDPQGSSAYILEYDSTLNAADQAEAVFQSIPLIKPAGTEIGWMDEESWQYTRDLLVEHELLPEDASIDGAFTLDFLEAFKSVGEAQ
jgi:ABC-type nitrate/sulfonate/bicarbonate transport system substrate-binding protein